MQEEKEHHTPGFLGNRARGALVPMATPPLTTLGPLQGSSWGRAGQSEHHNAALSYSGGPVACTRLYVQMHCATSRLLHAACHNTRLFMHPAVSCDSAQGHLKYHLLHSVF